MTGPHPHPGVAVESWLCSLLLLNAQTQQQPSRTAGAQFDIRAQPSCRVNGTVPLITILKHSSFPSGAKARPEAGSREEAGLVRESVEAAHPAADSAAQAAPDDEAQVGHDAT